MWRYVDTTKWWVKLLQPFVGYLFDCSDVRFWNSGYWIKSITTKEGKKE